MPAVYRVLAVLAAGAACGCGEKPRAPALTREAVYRNDKIGLRFATPDGWAMHSKAELPPGPLPKPVVAVAYLSPKGEIPASFQVEVADAVADADVDKFLTANPVGGEKWATKGPAAKATVNGAEAVRVTLARAGKRGEVLREVTMFRRGDRSYFFLITFDTTDRDARDQAHQSVASVAWN